MSTTPILPDTVVRRSDSMLFSELENEIVMMDVQEGNYYGLEDPATRIWELTENPVSVRDLCAALQKEYDVTPEQCETEVAAFVEELRSYKIIEVGAA